MSGEKSALQRLLEAIADGAIGEGIAALVASARPSTYREDALSTLAAVDVALDELARTLSEDAEDGLPAACLVIQQLRMRIEKGERL